jgi:hypothetical protein
MKNISIRSPARRCAVLSTAVAVLLCSIPAYAEQSTWAWVRVSSTHNAWSVDQNKARVEIVGDDIVIDVGAWLHIDAKVVGPGIPTGYAHTRGVVATVVNKATDYSVRPTTYHGRLTEQRFSDGSGTRQVIILEDGFNVLAFTREF